MRNRFFKSVFANQLFKGKLSLDTTKQIFSDHRSFLIEEKNLKVWLDFYFYFASITKLPCTGLCINLFLSFCLRPFCKYTVVGSNKFKRETATEESSKQESEDKFQRFIYAPWISARYNSRQSFNIFPPVWSCWSLVRSFKSMASILKADVLR